VAGRQGARRRHQQCDDGEGAPECEVEDELTVSSFFFAFCFCHVVISLLLLGLFCSVCWTLRLPCCCFTIHTRTHLSTNLHVPMPNVFIHSHPILVPFPIPNSYCCPSFTFLVQATYPMKEKFRVEETVEGRSVVIPQLGTFMFEKGSILPVYYTPRP
jgi:hypothetical protein